MRFTISREKLQEGLGAVAASIPAKTTLPVLSNILLETTERGIRLSGTDLDIAVSTEVAADVETAGAITIPAKKLTEIARELPPSPVKMAAAGEQRVTLDCGRSHFKILGLPKDEFQWVKRLVVEPMYRRRVNLHLRVAGRANQRYALLFRDYLRAHPDTAAAYGEFKRRAATLPLESIGEYADLKDPVCDLIYLPAEDWAARTGWTA